MESVTQAVSNLALQFGDDDAGIGAMVSIQGIRVLISHIAKCNAKQPTITSRKQKCALKTLTTVVHISDV